MLYYPLLCLRNLTHPGHEPTQHFLQCLNCSQPRKFNTNRTLRPPPNSRVKVLLCIEFSLPVKPDNLISQLSEPKEFCRAVLKCISDSEEFPLPAGSTQRIFPSYLFDRNQKYRFIFFVCDRQHTMRSHS